MQDGHRNSRVYPGSGLETVRPAKVRCTVYLAPRVLDIRVYKQGERGSEALKSLASANIRGD